MATTVNNPAKINTDKAPVIRTERASFRCRKRRKPDGQEGATEKHQPNDAGYDAIGHHKAFTSSLTDAIDLPQDLGQDEPFVGAE